MLRLAASNDPQPDIETRCNRPLTDTRQQHDDIPADPPRNDERQILKPGQ